MNYIRIRRYKLFLALLLFILIITQAAGERLSHVNPDEVTTSDNSLNNRQLQILNELMSNWNGVFISLNKGDIKNAQENVADYLQLLQENNNILVEIEGNTYSELIESGDTLNLTMNQVEKLRILYDEGNIAYQNNQTQKAIQIAVEAKGIIGDLNSYQDKFIMDAVEQFPGLNIADYQNGSLAYNEVLNNLKKRWQPVELTLFDDSLISMTVYPEEAEFGDVIYIEGVLTTPKNRMGIQDANITLKIDSKVIISVTTDRLGRYNYTYKVPYNKPGQYPINVEFVPQKEPLLSSYAGSYFDLIPTNTSLTIETKPDKGIFGDTIHIYGSLFVINDSGVADTNISISLANRTIGSIKTDANGTYTYNLQVQDQSEGIHTLKANFISDEQPLLGSSAITSIRLITTNTSLTILTNSDSVEFNDIMQISGKISVENDLILVDAKIDILLDDQTMDFVNIDDNGEYRYLLKIPPISEGTHVIQAKYITDDALLLTSSNNTSITIKPTNTRLNISVPEEVHQDNYLNIFWNVTTDKGFPIQNASITVLFDENTIGSAIAKSSDFYVSYWIDQNIPTGKHNITVKYNGNSPFLPFEKTIAIDILEPEFNYGLLYIIGVFGIMIFAFYLKKDRFFQLKVGSIISSLNSRIERTKTPETLPEIEEKRIEPDEPEIQKEEKLLEVETEEVDKKLEKTFSDIHDLIAKSQYNISISLTYITIKNKISNFVGINHTQCLTHREFYNIVKDKIPAINDEMKDVTEFYERAMYSGIIVNKEHALKCVELANNIINELRNEK